MTVGRWSVPPAVDLVVVGVVGLGERRERRTVVHQPAVAHHDRAADEVGQRAELVGDQHDRRAARHQTAEGGRERLLRLHVHARGRLVEDEQVGCAGQGPGDQNPLLLAAGKGGDAVAEPVLRARPPRPPRRSRAGRARLSGRNGGAPREPAGRHDLADGGGDAGGGRGALRHEADPLPGGELPERGAEQAHLAAHGGHQPQHGPHQRRLAGAVGAQDRDDLAGPDVQVDAAQHRAAAELDGDVAGPDQGVGHEQSFASAGRVQVGPHERQVVLVRGGVGETLDRVEHRRSRPRSLGEAVGELRGWRASRRTPW